MLEKELWLKVKTSWPHVHCDRIENAASFGTPDVNCCHDGCEWWMELKVTVNGMTKIRHTQLAWLARRVAVNGRIYIMAAEEATNKVSLFYAKELFTATDVIMAQIGQLKLNVHRLTPIIVAEMTKPGFLEIFNKIKCLQD